MKKWIPEIAIIIIALVLRVLSLFSVMPSMTEARIMLFSSQPVENIWNLYHIGAEKYFCGTVWSLFLNKLLSEMGGLATMRLFSVIAGIFSIIVFYFLARRLFGVSAARFSTFFLAVAPAHVIISRTASPHSFSFLLTIVALFYFYKFFEKDISTPEIVFFSTTIITGCFFNYLTLFLIIPANILFFVFKKKEEKDYYWWLPLQAILIFAVWLWWKKWTVGYFSLSTAPTFTGDMTASGVIVKEGLFNLQIKLLFVEKYIQFLYHIGGFFSGSHLSNGWSVLGVLLIPIVYHYFPFLGFREYEGGYSKRLFVFIHVSVFLGLATLLSFTSENLQLILLPAACILYIIMGHGAAKFGSLKAKVLLFAMALTMMFGYAPTVIRVEKGRSDWNAVATVTNGTYAPTAPVVFIDGWMDAPFLVLHPEMADRVWGLFSNFDMEFLLAGDLRQDKILPFFKGRVDSYPPYEMVRMLTDYPELWVVRSVATGVEKSKQVQEYLNWLTGNTELIYEEDLGNEVVVTLLKYKPGDNSVKSTYY